MGYSLCINRVDGRQGDLPEATLDMALKTFHAMPWSEEIAEWLRIPQAQAEEFRPVFIVFDDAAHALHVMQYDDALTVNYYHPARKTQFGLHYQDAQESIPAALPHEKTTELFQTFFSGDQSAMIRLLAEFRSKEEQPQLSE